MKSTLTPTRQPSWTAGAAKLTITLGLPLLCTSLAAAQRVHISLAAFPLGGHGGARGAAAAPATAPPGFLGIGFRDVTEDRLTLLKLKEARGAEVIQVDHDGPAGIAGLTEHDVILQVNGQSIEGEEQLRRILRETPVGRNVTLVFSRYGQQQTLTMQTADRAALERQAWDQHQSVPDPSHSSSFHGNSFMGGSPLTNAPITAPPDPHGHSLIPSMLLNSSYTGVVLEMIGPQLAQYFGSQGGNGLLVRSVDPNSPAAAAGLRAGDVVVRANAVIVTGTSEWYKLVRGNRGKPVAVVIMRDRQEETLVLVPDSKKRSSLENPGLWQSGADEQAHAGTPGGLSEIN
ncbi:membrane-associated protease RseP (regulator of RpoE activity) [Granulicella aggregans]|uniref:Membrane-associated protease RseP (Regulator of RpoE activity) n=1 Tax=Granulicella aggregans TaxID=474949 RepID=A0A7W7ZEQ5_9BACT|nr:PDZ domain-containing protein [Granulicella aggregans]MBB5058432.1 membrane-associated protease RseP (regulator of RpoE activity) [Granulicella aggregans]